MLESRESISFGRKRKKKKKEPAPKEVCWCGAELMFGTCWNTHNHEQVKKEQEEAKKERGWL